MGQSTDFSRIKTDVDSSNFELQTTSSGEFRRFCYQMRILSNKGYSIIKRCHKMTALRKQPIEWKIKGYLRTLHSHIPILTFKSCVKTDENYRGEFHSF